MTITFKFRSDKTDVTGAHYSDTRIPIPRKGELVNLDIEGSNVSGIVDKVEYFVDSRKVYIYLK